MCLVVVASDLKFAVLTRASEVAVLAQTEMVAVRTDESAADDWPHVARDTFVVVVSCEPVSQNWDLYAVKIMIWALELVSRNQVLHWVIFFRFF